MRWQFTPLLAIFLVLASSVLAQPAANWPDVVHPPTAADRTAIIANGWAASRDAIATALTSHYRPSNSSGPGSTGQATYQLWLNEWQWCDLLSRNETDEGKRFLGLHVYQSSKTQKFVTIMPGQQPQPGDKRAPASALTQSSQSSSLHQLLKPDSLPLKDQLLAAILPPDLQSEWTADDDFLRLLFASLSPDDYTPAVMRNLVAMQQAEPTQFHAYRSLAIAIAVVYDQNLPTDWPHSQVAHNKVPLADNSPAEWFSFWVKSNETKACLLDLRKLTPEELKFVVDAPLEESEFEWVRKNVQHQQADFEQAFFDIKYVTARATKNVMNWPGAEYTLANIKSQGGICVDQAYYASIAGKARGLPTLYFSGQGSDGGHAWFGYLKTGETWALDCGRYANQNFVVGFTLDPQTWTKISDHQLARLLDHFHSLPAFTASQDDVLMAGLFETEGDNTLAAKALDSAIAVCSKNSDAWDAKTDFLEKTGATAAILRTHHQAALRQFSGEPDIVTAHQIALVAIAESQGDTNTANLLRRQIVDDNQLARSDLSIDTVAQKITDLMSAKNYTGAFYEFQNQVPVLGPKGGGDFFNKIAGPLIRGLYNSGDKTHAIEAVDLTRRTLKPAKDTILDNNIKKVEDLVNGTHTATAANSTVN